MQDSERGSTADWERTSSEGSDVCTTGRSRRRWSAGEKARIVRESFWPAKRVEDVARRYGLSRKHCRRGAALRARAVADRGERQRKVRLRRARNHLPLERLVVGDGTRPVGGAQRQRERELCGAPPVAPPEFVRGVRSTASDLRLNRPPARQLSRISHSF